MPFTILHWLDAHPVVYWIPSLAMLGVLIGWLARKAWREAGAGVTPDAGHGGGWRDDVVFAGLILVTLLAWRWPQLIYSHESSPDESQQISGVITLAHHPLFWNAIDGGTAGPLNFYALMPLQWIGIPVGYFSARLTLAILLTGIVVAIQRLATPACGPAIARICCLPALLFFAFSTLYDFVSYSTEYVAMLLVAASTALVAGILANARQRTPTPGSLWAIGLMLGAVPWSKLQALPLAAAVGGAAMLAVICVGDFSLRHRTRLAGHLIVAALLPSAIAFALILAMGEWENFYTSYIAYNRIYAGDRHLDWFIARALWTSAQSESRVFPVFAVTTFLVGLSATLAAFYFRRSRAELLGAAVLVGAAVVAVLAPGRGFPHYLVLLIAPLTIWCALGLGLWVHLLPLARRRVFVASALIALTVPMLAARLVRPAPSPWGIMEWVCCRGPSSLSQLILENSNSGDSLAIWGWSPQVYVETKRPQATRDGHSQRQIEDTPLRDYYRQRYLADLERTTPTVFVDAVGPNRYAYQDRGTYGHETYPELARHVQENFSLKADIEGARVYTRHPAGREEPARKP